jgi:protocatechuate 3,4-dioxygenase, beta subunit
MRKKLLVISLAAAVLLSACGQSTDPTAAPTAPVNETLDGPPTLAPAEAEPTLPLPVPTAETGGYPVPDAAANQAPPAAGYPVPDAAAAQVPPAGYPAPAGPVAVDYVTQPQQEGPYYPLEKPAERDNDLTVVAGAPGPALGDVLEFGGLLLDVNGMPVAGAVIEIWQTDAKGIYLHPGDANTAERDMNFQFYGEAVTDAGGHYEFRTILPGEYEPRPRHIHFKVKLNGQELLTSQLYPEGGPAGPSGQDASLILALAAGQDVAGNPVYTAQRDIVLSQDLSGA